MKVRIALCNHLPNSLNYFTLSPEPRFKENDAHFKEEEGREVNTKIRGRKERPVALNMSHKASGDHVNLYLPKKIIYNYIS